MNLFIKVLFSVRLYRAFAIARVQPHVALRLTKQCFEVVAHVHFLHFIIFIKPRLGSSSIPTSRLSSSPSNPPPPPPLEKPHTPLHLLLQRSIKTPVPFLPTAHSESSDRDQPMTPTLIPSRLSNVPPHLHNDANLHHRTQPAALIP